MQRHRGSSMCCQSQQLADGSGISIWTVRGYEQNHREPNWKAALKVARALGVTLEAFAD
jgi:DNA-binding XRE family transcriptional regulator